MINDSNIAKTLHNVGVDVVSLVDLISFIPREFGGQMTFQEFMHMMLQLRGKKPATVKDIVELKKFVKESIQKEHEQTKARMTTLHNGTRVNHDTVVRTGFEERLD